MPEQTYYMKRKRKYKRIVVDLQKDLYRLFRASSYRKDAATDSDGLRQLLRDVLRKEQ